MDGCCWARGMVIEEDLARFLKSRSIWIEVQAREGS